jgi:hypothetical protein
MNFGDGSFSDQSPKLHRFSMLAEEGWRRLLGPLLPRTHVRSSYEERDRQREERELKEGKEAIAREIAERNRKAGWG